MKCQAKITDPWGNKYKCYNDATDILTITTFAPHLQRNVITVKKLCKKHLSRTKSRYNYQIKHCHKKTTLMENSIVRHNLLNEKNYRPYCGDTKCQYDMPRTVFNGQQFKCTCGWTSEFPEIFITKYKAKWNTSLKD